jgi:hypothetical protein
LLLNQALDGREDDMAGHWKRLLRWTKPRTSLQSQILDAPPHGQLLALNCTQAHARLKENAVGDRLRQYVDGGMPFVGLLVDLGETAYQLSSIDLAAVASTIAAWKRGYVAPCAIVTTGSAARLLRDLLRLTKLDELEQLQVVETVDAGRAHILNCLEQRAV